MLKKWLTFGLSREQEDRFRQANLSSDITQARICIWLVPLPLVAFVVNDYSFLGPSWRFYMVIAIRLTLLLYTFLLLKNLRGMTKYLSYDRAIFSWGLSFAVFTIVVAATRPQAYIAHAIITVLSVFVTVLAVPTQFVNQLILSLTFTIGETSIIAVGLPASPQASITALTSLWLANVIAVICGWQLHSWRRLEFQAREAAQKAEKELLGYTEELRRSNQALEDFASIASHDLQEPLRKVQGFGNMLKSSYGQELGDQGQDYLERIQQATARMQKMVNGLLDYARITSHGSPYEPVDLAKVAQEVLLDLEFRIEQANGTVEIDSLPIINADSLQMHQLLQNLIGNALKFHKPEIPPVVKVWAEDSTGNRNETRCFRLMVQDNGIGFEEQYADKLFQPFTRLHGRNEYEGSGIGLAICQKIAERHGGSITVRSRPAEGATFIVTLPL